MDLKYGLLPDFFAVGGALGIGRRDDGWHDLQAHFTGIFTHTVSPELELDVTGRFIFVSDTEDLGRLGKIDNAVTLGLRIRSDCWRWELHPEGIMVEDITHRVSDERSTVYGFGVAVLFSP